MRRLAGLCLALAACGGAVAEAPGAGEPADAAVPDAGATDAGATDAGTTDAGMQNDVGISDAGPVLHAGVLAGIQGLRYVSGAASGVTDAQGVFQWEEGARVAFYAGGLELAAVQPAPLLTPFALSGSCAAGPLLRKLLVLLATLDGASPDPALLAGKKLADIDLAAALAQLAPGKAIADENAAVDRFIAQVDEEDWQQTGEDRFSLQDSATRSQGVDTGGASYWFSWRFGLSRTALDYSVQASKAQAIPAQLLLEGINHIGDITVRDGTLYAPLEDGSKFKHPRVAFFDAQTLQFRSSVTLDLALQPDGVPWLTVWDGMLVTSRWDPAAELHLWDMGGGFLRALPLRPAQGRIQGAKEQHGMLYATRDSDPKMVLKINLETGTVLELFPVPDTKEIEGIAVLGESLHTLGVISGGSELRHWKRVRPPLREQVCR
jgi:hypothetical protein